MSAKVQGLMWSYYREAVFGAPKILAVALADEADDMGGGIFQSNCALAEKTDQGERAVRYQLRRLEGSRLLVVVDRSGGGHGKFSQYRLDLAVLISLANPALGAPETRHGVPSFEAPNPAQDAGLSGATYKSSKDLKNVEDPGTRNAVQPGAEDERLGKWMLAKLRELNPKHRDPSWIAWLRDLRLMRERDQRTHREIAELFAWANADPFWRVNILSPGKLREKWDQLQIKRGVVGAQAPGQTEDRQCVEADGDARCAAKGSFKGGDQRWRCLGHREREHQGAQA